MPENAVMVPTSVIRSIAGVSTTDHLFSRLYPSGWRLFGNEGHLRDDALGAYLAGATSAQAIGLRNWAQRAIVFPAQKTRALRGIVLGPATEAEP
jgi:monomeric isocitrate dehydrogenase